MKHFLSSAKTLMMLSIVNIFLQNNLQNSKNNNNDK